MSLIVFTFPILKTKQKGLLRFLPGGVKMMRRKEGAQMEDGKDKIIIINERGANGATKIS